MDLETKFFYKTNPTVQQYINNIKADKKINIKTYYNKEGIFITESDDKNYYKIILFKV